SPLVTILALVIWGQIWGITGMLLSTPITVVMVIIFSQFESTRSVAIFLSEDGNIDDAYKPVEK
ncbi:MAG: AI-2E family transporter, partial [Bacteroidota bacterium]